MNIPRFPFACACASAFLLTAGCAWQRIPPPPSYRPTESLPIRAKARFLGDRSSLLNGQRVLKNLQTWQVFESLSYPPSRRDKRGIFLTMEVTGAWDVPVAANNARSFLVGFSLYTLSPVVGQTMTGRYQLVATLDVRGRKVAEYEIKQDTPVSWGIAADGLDAAHKALDVEMAWLAYELAEQLKNDWPRIAAKLGK